MRQIVILVFSTLILFSFNGCCPKCPEPNIIYVPQKCTIPSVEKPTIDNIKYDSNADIVSKAILNYIEMKKYAEKLLNSQEVCK